MSGGERSPMSRLRRLRLGELGALLGAVCVIVSLTLPWYGAPAHPSGAASGGSLSAWSTFDAAVAFIILGCVAAISLALANVFERSTAIPVAAAVWATLFGFGASIAAIVRLASATAPLFAPWLALIGSLAMLLGGWQSMRDERPELYDPARPERREL